MKTTLLLFSLFLIPAISHAEKKQMSKTDMKMLGKIDESTLNAEAKKEEAAPAPEKVKSKVTLNCKEQDGRVFNQGEVGYDTCLQNLKNRSMFSKKNSGAGSSNDPKDQNSAGMSFKIGD